MRRLLLTAIFVAFGLTESGAQSTPVQLSQPVFVPSEPSTPAKQKKKKSKNGFLRAVANSALNLAVNVAESKLSNTPISNSGTSNNISPTTGNYGVPAANNINPTSGYYGTSATNASTPINQLSTPVTNGFKPVQQLSTPVTNGFTLVELSTPVKNAFEPLKQLSTPVTDGFKPVQQLSNPVTDGFKPVQQLSTPVTNGFTPVELSTPITDGFKPVQQLSNPLELSKQGGNFTIPQQLGKPIVLSNSLKVDQLNIKDVKLDNSKSITLTQPNKLDAAIDVSRQIAEGRWLGTGYVENANNWYQQQYIKSAINGKPNNLYLAGVGMTSIWMPNTYQTTLNAFTLGAGIGYNKTVGFASIASKEIVVSSSDINVVKKGFKIEGQLEEIFGNKKYFSNWLKGNQSLSRIKNPLNSSEAQQIIDNAKRRNLPIESNINGLKGLEVTGQWKGVSHFKVGNIHIPIQKGLENVLKF